MTRGALPLEDGARRRWLKQLAIGALTAGMGKAVGAAAPGTIRVGMTPAFLNDQYSLLADWRAYLQAKLGMPVEFVQRDRYRETMDLLHLGKLDFAWLCDYPFVFLKDLVRLLVVPLNQGRPYYRSLLLVGAADRRRNSMADLAGGVFAFADPYSNTGYLAPRYRIRELGRDPNTFFRQTYFTWSHRKVIEAVSKGFADGGAVDSFVWDTLEKVRPDVTQGARIIERSPEYAFPPFAAHRAVPAEMFERMQKVLIGMSQDESGRLLLTRLNLDGFIVGRRQMYDSVAKMMAAFGEI
ncbi:MAG: PhnD/SsuA/transferrin family substrate-binding protein [Rhodocyclaceae bacterium]|jgi:phosphonate transport system substrate-binding protein|nr:PhnD/SsuA/transferrin family substrate-binding protein [Rhodocyclaceae bacterium]